MKKIIAIAATAALMCSLTACGGKTAEAPETTVVETTVAETAVSETAPMESLTEAVAEETAATIAAEESIRTDFADNFEVDSVSAEAFAKKIQAAVAAEDLEALAELAAYPLYVGFADGGVSVNNAQEFLDLGAERIFTAEMLASMEGAPTADLMASKAGFSLTKEGRPNIIFGVRDGALAVQGINY